jgi:hypothetical protein
MVKKRGLSLMADYVSAAEVEQARNDDEPPSISRTSANTALNPGHEKWDVPSHVGMIIQRRGIGRSVWQ